MAEATTGTNLTNTNSGVLSKISSAYANVRKLSSDPAIQKSIPLAFGVIVTFVGIIVFFIAVNEFEHQLNILQCNMSVI